MQPILSVLVFVAAISCTYGQEFCPLIYNPVCGSDGVTYSNDCFFGIAKRHSPSLTKVDHGECRSRDKRAVDTDDCPEYSKKGICTLEYAPVCASNGKTYANKCEMCADMYAQIKQTGQEVLLRVVHPGKCGSLDYCLPSDKTGACTDDYRPICGSDGKTYGNRCEFCYNKYQMIEKGEELNFEYGGECQRCPPNSVYGKCPKIYKPVCGSDGKTYSSLCVMCFHVYSTWGFNENDFKLKHLGPCE